MGRFLVRTPLNFRILLDLDKDILIQIRLINHIGLVQIFESILAHVVQDGATEVMLDELPVAFQKVNLFMHLFIFVWNGM